MDAAPREAARRIGRNGLVAAAAALAVLAVLAATPQLYGSRVGDAFERLGQAQPAWLWLGARGFLCSLCGSAGARRSALRLCGGRLDLLQANAYYGTGSLVNTFVPARVGDAARIALFSRALDGPNRLLTTGGAFAAIGAARAVALAMLVIAGAAVGAMPLWPLAVLASLVGLAVLAWLLGEDGQHLVGAGGGLVDGADHRLLLGGQGHHEAREEHHAATGQSRQDLRHAYVLFWRLHFWDRGAGDSRCGLAGGVVHCFMPSAGGPSPAPGVSAADAWAARS